MSKVSVGIIAYNQEKLLGKALKSVFSQSRKADEIIVVDNGSKDNTRAVVLKYKGQIRYIRLSENIGALQAFNAVLKAAKFDYIMLLSGDDWFGKTIIEEEAKVLDENPEIGLVYAQAFTVEGGETSLKVASPCGSQTVIGRWEFERLLTQGDFIPLLTVMVRRKIIKKLGFLDVNLNFRGDWELLIRIAKNYPFAYIAKPLAYYRVGYNFGILNDKFHASFKSEFKYILEKHLPKSTKKLADLRARAFNFYYMQLIRESLYDGKFLEGIAYLPNLLKRYVNLFW